MSNIHNDYDIPLDKSKRLKISLDNENRIDDKAAPYYEQYRPHNIQEIKNYKNKYDNRFYYSIKKRSSINVNEEEEYFWTYKSQAMLSNVTPIPNDIIRRR